MTHASKISWQNSNNFNSFATVGGLGPRPVTPDEVAATFAELLDRPVRMDAVPRGRGHLFARDDDLAQTGIEFAPSSIAPRVADARVLARLEHETKAAGRRIVPLRRSPPHIRFLPS